MSYSDSFVRWQSVANWLFVIACSIALMVVVGGLTRLTGSGLSITEWKPIYGAIPPLTQFQWLEEFKAYQQIPQFSQINPFMSLGEFKFIFWWEWGHRQLGRFIGFLFLIPMLWFWFRKSIPQGYKPVVIALFLGGGLQGLIGWLMVKSGLSDRLYVSHYRLAMHLGFALILYYFVLHTAILLHQRRFFILPKFSPTLFLTVCIFIQILSGALTAGLHAGHIYNSWPLMDNQIIPDGLFPTNLLTSLNDLMTVQFMHRILAYLVFFVTLWVTYQEYRVKNYGHAALIFSVVTGQIILGIVTLIWVAPVNHIWLAALHQFGSVILFSSCCYLNARKI